MLMVLHKDDVNSVCLVSSQFFSVDPVFSSTDCEGTVITTLRHFCLGGFKGIGDKGRGY